MTVDYGKSTIEVYKDFTEFCVKSSGSLDIICRPWAIKEEHTNKLPSWIPLLADSEFGGPSEAYGGRKNGQSLVGPAGRSRYSASGDNNATVIFEPNENFGFTLSVPGFRLATIEEVSFPNLAGLILRESLRLIGWNKNEEPPDAIWRTLVADRDSEGQVPPTWYKRACIRCLEIATNCNDGDLNIGLLLQQQDSELLRIFLRRVLSVTWNRKFFRAAMETKGGEAMKGEGKGRKAKGGEGKGIEPNQSNQLIGLCPRNAEKGDYICILFGCSVPVLLRKHDHGFMLVGETYVHGKMYGEATEDPYEIGLREETFCLT